MTKNKLINSVSKAYVIAEYLKSFHREVGDEVYLKSPIRYEHGTGKGFFGVSNTGSNDCLKETIRGITDGLGLRFDTFNKINFVSQTCINLENRSKSIHRIEHTIEVSTLFENFESEFIRGQKFFDANLLGRYFIENQIVCLIEQKEQVGKYSEKAPFHKYSSHIFHSQINVSNFSHEQIIELNKKDFINELQFIDNFNFEGINQIIKTKMICLKTKYRMPPLDLAIKYSLDEMNLLHHHYNHKLSKRITPGNKWFSIEDKSKYEFWLKQHSGNTY
jgi:hypothetical protein